ncbi:MAG: HemK2/MTQ2 family protein methyltransferase [archaeon]
MIYQPAEDSFLLEKEVEKLASGKRVLDVGTGSGILAQAAWKAGAKQVLAVDIDEEALEKLKSEEFETKKSDLLSEVYGEFDLIVFNPPYLPKDEREDAESALATSGGARGDEIIVRFLESVGRHLASGGKVLLLVSSLTPLDRIEKTLTERRLAKKVVASKKIFMEELWVWEINKT